MSAERLDRRDAVRELLADCGDLLVLAGLGSPSYDLMAAGDRPRNFYLWGAMGGAAALGLGLAVARPAERVLVLTGDGEQLMGLGALATIGARRPTNLTVAVLDNGRYGETGMQPSHTALGVDLAGAASACGFAWSERVEDLAGIAALRARLKRNDGPAFAAIAVRPEESPRVLPPRDGVELKNRFRRALGLATM